MNKANTQAPETENPKAQERILDELLTNPAFAEHIVLEKRLPAVPPSMAPIPDDVDPRLKEALYSRGIQALYTHQVNVWNHVRSGRHTIVVTPTASGKTLCYNLPTLQALLEDEHARALYLFPTKALSQDQQAELNELVNGKSGVLPIKVCTYDGDTPDSLRIAARDTGRIIVSNPDMLHAGILPNHPKWIKFFSCLKYVVIDEAHTYRGVFGSHVANVLRRLLRIAAFYGSHPVMILCSATIGNPKELAEQLIGQPVSLVDKNGAPRGEKRIVLYNPPLVDAVQGIRRSVVTESRRWTVSLLRSGIKTILFAHSRLKTEVAASYIREDLANIYTDNHHIRVEPYRGGLLPNERREIEKGLRDGTIQGVVSTNALELGIDIGGLDAAVVAGFPGSFNSFWQQIGRAGRRGGTSVAIFIASSSPLDQYIINHPDWFFRSSAEEARLDPDNPYILTDHVKCAAFELPFTDADMDLGRDPFGSKVQDVLEYLEEEGIVRAVSGRWYWADRSYPAESISLRSATADNVAIIDTTQGRNIVIGEMDRPSAKELVFDNAVYMHRGRQYLVTKLDIQKRKCLVEEANVNYYTDALVKTDIKVLSEDEKLDVPGSWCRLVLGDVLVRSQVAKFKKIRFHTHENIGYGTIELPEEELQTRSLALLLESDTSLGTALQGRDEQEIGRILSGIGSLIKRIAPIFVLCDQRDIGISERVRDTHFMVPALYIYDHYPGGTGLAEALVQKIPSLVQTVAETVAACPCESGCPSCVGPDGDKAAVLDFLRPVLDHGGKS
ncbi:DEAD/DEAH box helicase [Gracilinema caldarium]|uniref:DEAD/DEAH box helicase domain protein n=1 Tax=Gracilinema caldarium (strain ATCC 51460 / DSM 7334 / H1) TaxID=744872 RepID=F8F1R1_GRAC1|nr:DEAD/DEAH box helicase [Gracilinema caldarium]AEJ19395.1 DEAD/DEAH box helicase domain protein [Gracilinema caldarium DSM 7334]